MNRLRPQGLLLALVLTALPASSAHAWPADSRNPSLSRVEVTTIDMQDGVAAFRYDHQAFAGLSVSEPGMEKTPCLTVNKAGEQGSDTAMVAFAGDWNFDVPGMHNREYHFYVPPGVPRTSPGCQSRNTQTGAPGVPQWGLFCGSRSTRSLEPFQTHSTGRAESYG
jgi:hypothetical protein